MADSSQVGQILLNLGINARDAMPDGGTLTVETENVELREDFCAAYPELKPGPYVLLTVSDTGHGLDKETIKRIFDPFFTTKSMAKNTGLGLATVYGIVKLHRGHITCCSEPGRGTTFRVYFPAMKRELEEKTSTEEPVPKGGTETILLVDDEKDLLQLAVKMLSCFGYKVMEAVDGKEALGIYKEQKESVSIVILDLIMPKMDGQHCLDEILKLNPEAKVLIASGYSDEATRKGLLEKGAGGFVSKPYRLRQLLQTVRDVLDAD